MKHIVKNPEPHEFASWKEHRREEIERKTREGNMDVVFGILQNPPNPETDTEDAAPYYKNQLREALLKEQGYICGYCTRSISNSHTTKIDHFLPKEIGPYRQLVFAYGNLLACCDGGERDKGKPREVYCDTKKGNQDPTNPVQVVSPFDINCESFFEFDEMGKIHAASGEERAAKTIEFFGLDARALNVLRKTAIKSFLEESLKEYEDMASAIDDLRHKSISGTFAPFCTAIISVLRNYP